MMKRYAYLLLAAGALLPGAAARAQDLDELQEKAIKAAVAKVAPCVVQIETSGGTEVVQLGPRGLLRTGHGPTSGLVVHADGYVISSAFNFAKKPAAIHVSVPGHKERYVADIVAQDQTRMLTLLKLNGVQGKLPVPEAAPKSGIKIGHTAIAAGRTLAVAGQSPSITVGIISALDRIWGRAFQTDAKISPTNYGGPLIDLYGRVQGVLVPASPRAEGETAGFDWYDSGIGFAVPLEDINRVLPRMLKGTDKNPVTLKRGLLGISMKAAPPGPAATGDAPAAVVEAVTPGSPAEKRGIKPGDTITAIDGKPVTSQDQLLHCLGPRYEGDKVAVTLKRGKEEIKLDAVELSGAVAAHDQPFLGILPIRDDPDPGVEIRFVYPDSPAAKAKLVAGDRLMKVGRALRPGIVQMQPIPGRNQLLTLIESQVPGADLSFEVKRKAGGKTETVKVTLAGLPNTVPDKLPEKASAKKALAKTPAAKKDDKKEEKKVETGLLTRTTAAADHSYWVYVPENYDPNIAHAILVWLHPVGKNKEKDIDNFTLSWQFPCEDNHMIVVCPKAEAAGGWTQGESDFVLEAVKAVADAYTVDRQRIVVHGMGRGGEMAFYLGFHARGLFRGIATTGAALTSNPRDKLANQPLNFFLVVGDKDPLRDAVKETNDKLREHKYPVIFREIKDMGHEYIDGRLGTPTLEEMARWIDSLDRI
jgi:S1-C subfamily serine protease